MREFDSPDIIRVGSIFLRRRWYYSDVFAAPMPNRQSFIFVMVDITSSVPISVAISILHTRVRLDVLHAKV